MLNSEFKDTLSKLKFISKIQPGDKLNTQLLTIQTDNIFTKFLRTWFFNDDRTKTFRFISEIISTSFNILFLLSEEKTDYNNVICKTVYEDIESSIIGINNLIQTYQSDKFLCSQYELLIDDIYARLNDYKDKTDIVDTGQEKDLL